MLHRAVLRDYQGRIQVYADERDELERRWVGQALDMAGKPFIERASFVAQTFVTAQEKEARWVEAVTAAGAPFASVLTFAVFPQVFNRFVGFATYQFDSNLRNSTMIGVVGAGGIGGTLFAAFQRFDYDFLCTILLSIIALIMVSEFAATRVKAVFND